MSALLIAKATIVFASVLLATWCCRRATAATRHALLVAGQLMVLAIPLVSTFVPPLRIGVAPTSVAARISEPSAAARDDADDGATEAIPPVRTRTNSLALVYLAGVVAVALAKGISYGRAYALFRKAHRRVGGATLGGVTLGMDVFTSDAIAQPATFGTRIVLPRGAAEWSEERLRLVLCHERAHVRRRDTLLGVAGDLACAFYWFHPLAWWTARCARLERERACDDAVLRDGVATDAYAATLLDVARGIDSPALAMAAPSQLERRIRAILDPSVRRVRSRAAGFAIAAATLAALPLLASVSAALTIPRPHLGEPDLRGDAVASPYSERLPPLPLVSVEARGEDAELIATMLALSVRPPRREIDFVAERARWALTRVEDGRLVEPLLASLGDGDWRVRTYAAWSLGVAGDRRATQPLLAMLGEPIWRVRAMAATALADIADPAANDAILRAIDDSAWQVRMEVVRYLGAFGTRHHAAIRAMLADRHSAVRAAAEDVLRTR